ncbi:MAG: tetratricopeptide repeat protein [Kiritimatiellia bacterium]
MKTFLQSIAPATCFFLLLTACGRNPESLARKGIEALNEGRTEKAARWLSRAAEKSPQEPETADLWNYAGLAAYRNGQVEKAEAAFGRAIELNPQHFEALYNYGDLLLRENREEEARPLLQNAAAADTTRSEPLEVLAGIALRNGEFDSAFDLLSRALSREENARVFTSLAVAGGGLLPLSETLDLLQRAVTMDPSYAPAQLNLASILDQNRLDPEQAIAHYEAFLRSEPDDVKTAQVRQRIQIMNTRHASGDFARPDPVRVEVEDLLAQATAASRRGADAAVLQFCLRANAAAARAQRSDLRERALRAATTLSPESARAHLGLANFLKDQGRGREAFTHFRLAHTLAPAWPLALDSAVTAAAETGEQNLVRSLLETSQKAGSDNASLLLRVGDLYAAELNDPRQARRVYQMILDRFPDAPEVAEVQDRMAR